MKTDSIRGNEISGEEALTLLAGSLNAAKPIARSLARSCSIFVRLAQTDGISEGTAVPARPRRRVREEHRPLIVPGAVATKLPDRVMSLLEARHLAVTLRSGGFAPAYILDQVRSATGLPWETAGALLAHAGLLTAPSLEFTVALARSAREFWHQWAARCSEYAVAVGLGQIRAAAGEWGIVEPRHLQTILPGFQPPKSALRVEWLVRRVEAESGPGELDFYSASYKPLFTLPLA